MTFTELMAAAQGFFFRAMQQGYVASHEKNTIPGLPFSKKVSFKEGNFMLVDCWTTTPNSNRSWGFTQIYVGDSGTSVWVPVWVMMYGGEYQPEAIKFLKDALAASYINPSPEGFNGCRGPALFGHGELVYQNKLDEGCDHDFSGFSGSEGIGLLADLQDGDLQWTLGYHYYHGWSLIPSS